MSKSKLSADARRDWEARVAEATWAIVNAPHQRPAPVLRTVEKAESSAPPRLAPIFPATPPEPAPGPTLEQVEARWGQVTADYRRPDPVLRKAESDLTAAEQSRARLLTKFAADAQAVGAPAGPVLSPAELAWAAAAADARASIALKLEGF